MKIKSPPSPAWRGICSVTFDVVDAKSPSFRASPGALEESADHQGRSRQSQTDKESQTVLIGAEYEPQRPSPDMTHGTEEEDTEQIKAETQTDHVASDVDVAEEKEEITVITQQQATEPDEKPRPESALSSSEPPAPETGEETMNKEGELDDGDHEGIETEETEEQVELKDEEAEAAHEATVDDNPEESRSAEPDVGPSTAACKDSEKSISHKRNERVERRGSRSLRHLKVLQAPVVRTQVLVLW